MLELKTKPNNNLTTFFILTPSMRSIFYKASMVKTSLTEIVYKAISNALAAKPCSFLFGFFFGGMGRILLK